MMVNVDSADPVDCVDRNGMPNAEGQENEQRERTQELLLRWSKDGGKTYREILRQQFKFSSFAR